MKTRTAGKLKNALPPVLLLTATLFVSGALGLYLSNSGSFWFPLKTVAAVTAAGLLTALVLLAIPLILLPEKPCRILIRLIAGTALAMYVQYVINIPYGSGVLDGSAIDWSRYTGYAVLDTLVWLACLALPFLLSALPGVKKYADRIVAVLCLFLTLVQIPAAAVQLIGYRPETSRNLQMTADGEFELSSGKNMVMFILDTMDEKYYRDFIGRHPGYTEKLDGFVCYDNALASGAQTHLAIPLLMTGEPFRSECTYAEYLDRAYGGENPLSAMHRAGTDVRVYSDPACFSEAAAGYVDNLVIGEPAVSSYFDLGKRYFRMVAYTCAPHLLKRYLLVDTSDFDSYRDSKDHTLYRIWDAEFGRGFRERKFSVTDGCGSALRVYHLQAAHEPYTLTDRGETDPAGTGLEEQIDGVFGIMDDMLRDMREKGAYDDSVIVICADHGKRNQKEHGMLLIKESENTAPYATSALPVSYFDVTQMMYDFIGTEDVKIPFAARIDDLRDDAERTRRFFYYHENSSHYDVSEYETSAAAGDRDALTLIARHEYHAELPAYVTGTELSFASGGENPAKPYCADGFTAPQQTKTVLRGPVTSMEIPVADLPESGSLAVSVSLDVSDQTNGLRCVITANGVAVFEGVTVPDWKNGIRFSIPVEEAFRDSRDRLLNLVFSFPDLPQDEMKTRVKYRTVTTALTGMVIRREE